MYKKLIPQNTSTKSGKNKKTTVTNTKQKFARPATAAAPVMKITEVGSKAKSRLFDYKECHDKIKNKSMQ